MNKISSTYKGLITGLLMLAVSLGIYYAKGSFENNLQYITYALYVGGILWALIAFKNGPSENKTFKNYFTEGFKCFIVIVFVMVLFTFIFTKMHPELKEQMAATYRAGLVSKGNYTPPEIDKMVLQAKDYFVTMLVSMAIFGYLVIGAIVTLVGSIGLSRKN
ncbi:MAG: DUF4199 domain-containing protein [Ferruginibacter sp.]